MSSNNSSLSSNTGVTMPAFTTYQQSFDCSDFWMKSNLSHFIESQAEVFYYVNYINVNYSVKNWNVDCKYLLFLQEFFFRLKPKQYKKYQYSRLFKKTIWKLIKNKVNIYNEQLKFWRNNWRLHNWRSRKPQLQCANVTNIENCILALIETHAAALMQHCQFEVWIHCCS